MTRVGKSLVVSALFALSCAHAQLIIPQIADGGAWSTTIVVINTSSSTHFSLAFFQDAGGGATQP